MRIHYNTDVFNSSTFFANRTGQNKPYFINIFISLMFSSASGMVVHTLLGHANFEYALLMSIGSVIGGFIGARLSLEIKETRLRLLIITVILVAAIKLFLDAFGI